MTEDRAKEVIMAIILEAFDLIDESKRSATFAEMVPKLSQALFTGKRPERRDTARIKVIPREDPE